MNEVIRKALENAAMEAEEKTADHNDFSNWGAGRRARSSFAIALLQLEESRRLRRLLERLLGDGKPGVVVNNVPRGVVQEAAPQPVADADAVGDAGSSPAPVAKPERKRGRRRG